MRLLLTSDLHLDGEKLRWLLNEAPQHDALLVAGDLLDIFSNTGIQEQRSGALRWRQSVIDSGKSFAWCSGNHDYFFADNTQMFKASPLWMKETPSSATCVSDGETRVLEAGGERIAITTIPWQGRDGHIFVNEVATPFLDFVKSLLREGKKLQTDAGVPWIVLCHEPPGDTPLSTTYIAPEADFVRRMIEAAEPDFSLHGHIHQAPTTSGGSWIWQLGKATCFNAGQSHRGEPPHYILLEFRSSGDWTAVWEGNGCMQKAKGFKN